MTFSSIADRESKYGYATKELIDSMKGSYRSAEAEVAHITRKLQEPAEAVIGYQAAEIERLEADIKGLKEVITKNDRIFGTEIEGLKAKHHDELAHELRAHRQSAHVFVAEIEGLKAELKGQKAETKRAEREVQSCLAWGRRQK